MAGLTQTEKEALGLFKEKLVAEFGERLNSAQLFGSKARGEAAKHSDVDVLVVAQGAGWKERRQISGMTADVLLETGVFVSPKVFSPDQLAEMKRKRSMFWQTIEPDLIGI